VCNTELSVDGDPSVRVQLIQWRLWRASNPSVFTSFGRWFCGWDARSCSTVGRSVRLRVLGEVCKGEKSWNEVFMLQFRSNIRVVFFKCHNNPTHPTLTFKRPHSPPGVEVTQATILPTPRVLRTRSCKIAVQEVDTAYLPLWKMHRCSFRVCYDVI
jgi:hypothetical protein